MAKKQKLIRDKLGPDTPDHINYLLKGGQPYEVDKAPAALITLLLIGKLHEEAEEIRESMTDAEEYADAVQVLMDLAEHNRVAWSEIEYQRQLKETKKGGFKLGKVLRRDTR